MRNSSACIQSLLSLLSLEVVCGCCMNLVVQAALVLAIAVREEDIGGIRVQAAAANVKAVIPISHTKAVVVRHSNTIISDIPSPILIVMGRGVGGTLFVDHCWCLGQPGFCDSHGFHTIWQKGLPFDKFRDLLVEIVGTQTALVTRLLAAA